MNLLDRLDNTLWSIRPEKLRQIVGLLERHASGIRADAATLAAIAVERREQTKPYQASAVAVVPVFGTIAQRAGQMEQASGGLGVDAIRKAFDQAIADASVSHVVLQIDSPGGTVAGVPELAAHIYASRGSKPIVAIADAQAASAAYYLAAAADEIVVTPSGEIGSVGVMAIHYDLSQANERIGVKPSYITYGEHKAEYSEDAPLSDAARAELQRRVDEIGEQFVADVARFRGTKPSTVKSTYGQGRTFGAQEAVSRGMADRVEPFDALLTRLQTKPFRRKSARADNLRRRITLIRRQAGLS